jgi:hypothetical protein
VWGAPVTESTVTTPAALPPLQGGNYRYPRMCLTERFALDLVAIPAAMTQWSFGDWEVTALVISGVVTLMTPPVPSEDVRFQRWVQGTLGPNHFQLWTALGAPLIWTGISAAIVAEFLYGWIGGDDRFAEGASLMLEALSVAELYHVGLKLLIGREGPMNGDGLGIVHGPTASYFPNGTPSGHTTAIYALIGAADTYWGDPAVSVPLHLVGLFLAGMLIVDDLHFLSDVLFGGALGYCVGRWVARHRSSRYRDTEFGLERIVIVPTVAPAAGQYALGVGFRW